MKDIFQFFEHPTPEPQDGLRPDERLFTQHPRPPRFRNNRAEQIGKYGSPNGRKYEKNRANRLRRRAEKLDPANAPTKMIRGWND